MHYQVLIIFTKIMKLDDDGDDGDDLHYKLIRLLYCTVAVL